MLKADQPKEVSAPANPQQEAPIQASQPMPEPTTDNYESMYSAKINRLMDLALTDGELTEKEKQILFKNAEQEGIDLDEFEMVLEAKLFERSQQIQQVQVQQMAQMAPPPPAISQQQVASKSDKNNGVKKCPACGAMLQSFQTSCPDCGQDIIGVRANASIEKLFEMLNDIESTRSKSSISVIAKAFTYGADSVDKRKLECIKNFPIPTTREDILEFLCMAIPLAKKQKKRFWGATPEEAELVEKHNLFVPTWKAKCEQIIMKARFSMKEDKATLAEIENYAAELNKK